MGSLRSVVVVVSVLFLAGCSSVPTQTLTGNEAACAEFADFTRNVVDTLIYSDGAYIDVREELTGALQDADGAVEARIGAILLDLPDRTYDIVNDEHRTQFNQAIADVDAACDASGYAENAPTTIP